MIKYLNKFVVYKQKKWMKFEQKLLLKYIDGKRQYREERKLEKSY